MQTNTHKALCKLLQGDYRTETSEQLVKRVDGLVQALRTERDDLTKLSTDLRTQRDVLYERLTQVVDVTGEPTLEELLEHSVAERNKAVTTLEQAGYTDNGGALWEPPLGDTPERFKPRYIVHGDIQPCVVLYSDETTTLVRLDENDMMCETDTIEWSDELTYRCQEMLRGEAKRSGGHVSFTSIKLLAQLVRDERILLNDDHMTPNTCLVCAHVTDGTLDNCPQCHTPFGGSDDAGNEWTRNSSPTPLR